MSQRKTLSCEGSDSLRTERAIADDLWRSFPALRSVLEGKALPPSETPLLSTSTSVFEEIRRLVRIAALADHYRAVLLDTASKGGQSGTEELRRELRELDDRIRELTDAIARNGPDLRRLAAEVERLSRSS
jgi:hypothetical protein